MKVSEKKLSEIKPYKGNPRINSAAVEGVAESIKQFGFKQPIVIDDAGVIVCGHTRYKAAKKLKLKTAPCVIADDLTPEQIRAYRLADNKVAEYSVWDDKKLLAELEGIADIDMSDFGFDLEGLFADDQDKPEHEGDSEYDGEPEDYSDWGWEEEKGYYGDERERTYGLYNLRDFDESRCVGFYQMPVVHAGMHIPTDLIGFNDVLNTDDFDKCVHFYLDDYQIDRIWNNPRKYFDRIKHFDGMITPDFSLYTEMPKAMQVWNVYRSRLIGQMAQDAGIKVINNLTWTDPDSFEFCFDGIEPGGVVSVSTIGVKVEKDRTGIWFDGMDEAMKRIKPEHVIVYGGDIGYNFDCKVTYIDNHNTERLKSTGGKS